MRDPKEKVDNLGEVLTGKGIRVRDELGFRVDFHTRASLVRPLDGTSPGRC